MTEKRAAAVAPISITVLCLVIPCVYVAGYLWLGTVSTFEDGTVYRAYPNQWLAEVYRPAAAIEQRVRGCPVTTDDGNPFN